MHPATSSDTGAPAWERRRLLAVLAAAVAGVLLLAGGLVYAVVYALNPPTPATATGPAPIVVPAGTGSAYRDSIAAAPMLTVPPQASRPGAIPADPGPAIAVPPATTAGPGGVPSGFPHTAEGAVGQLGAIDSTVLTGMSLAATNEVHEAWSLNSGSGGGGVGGGDGWMMTAAVRGFLTAAKVPELTPGMSVVATPVAAQVKGTDGPDWVLACVLLQVEATIATTSQVAFGHCERMAWTKDTWLIEPGPVAPAPSTWPGTQVAIDAGWATWATPVGE